MHTLESRTYKPSIESSHPAFGGSLGGCSQHWSNNNISNFGRINLILVYLLCINIQPKNALRSSKIIHIIYNKKILRCFWNLRKENPTSLCPYSHSLSLNPFLSSQENMPNYDSKKSLLHKKPTFSFPILYKLNFHVNTLLHGIK